MTGIPKCCTFKDTICFKKANLQIFARVDSQEFRVTRPGMQRGSRVINQDLLLFPKMEEKKNLPGNFCQNAMMMIYEEVVFTFKDGGRRG